MKRLRNILTGALLVLGALSPAVVQADSIPVTQDGPKLQATSIRLLPASKP